MSNKRKVQCPACGGPAEVGRFAAMAVCEYCGAAFYFDRDAVMAMGEMAIMVEYPTPFYVHARGEFRGKRFEIAGRVRYRYSRGFWDEWYLRYEDGGDAWLVEDEGEYSFEKLVEDAGDVPGYEHLTPGTSLEVGGLSVIVDERDEAHLEGAEGELPFVLSKDRRFPYVDASQSDHTFTIEYAEDGPEVYEGVWVNEADFKLDAPKPVEGEGGFFEA